MGKFWKWMGEKEYIEIGCKEAGLYFDSLAFTDECIIWFDGCASAGLKRTLPKQMLTGYMIEYVQEIIQAENIGWMLREKDVYNTLEVIIKGWE